MIILAHRGLNKEFNAGFVESKTKAEFSKGCSGNTLSGFQQSFALGCGVEIDIRDHCGKLVVSHDMPNASILPFEAFLEIYKKHGNNLPLALNIKADGLCMTLKSLLDKYQVANYFVFDMSVPDMIPYAKSAMSIFTRQSEYEAEPAFYAESKGVWLDEFFKHWINEYVILSHIKNKKQVCIVSPDLHGREFLREWEDYKRIVEKHKLQNEIMLCTDYASVARRFFHE